MVSAPCDRPSPAAAPAMRVGVEVPVPPAYAAGDMVEMSLCKEFSSAFELFALASAITDMPVETCEGDAIPARVAASMSMVFVLCCRIAVTSGLYVPLEWVALFPVGKPSPGFGMRVMLT